MAALQAGMFSSLQYRDKETTALLSFQHETAFAYFFFPFSSYCFCANNGRGFFVFSSTWAGDLTESISFPKYTVRSWSVCFLVCPIALLLYTLMVSSHHRLFFSPFSGVYHMSVNNYIKHSSRAWCISVQKGLAFPLDAFFASSQLIWGAEEAVFNKCSLCRSFCGLQNSLLPGLWVFFIYF